MKTQNIEENYKKIGLKKLRLSLEELCTDLPYEFLLYMKYCRNLQFREEPDYKFLKSLFLGKMGKMKFHMDY